MRSYQLLLLLLPQLVFADVAEDNSYRWRQRIDASASSHLKEKGKPDHKYEASQVLDGSVATAWCASSDNATDGIGESIEIQLNGRRLKQVHLVNGYAATRALYFANNRIRKLKVDVTHNTGRQSSTTVSLAEKCEGKSDNAPCATGIPDYQVAKFKEACVEKIRFTVLEVYPGKKYHDTCIAEISLPDEVEFCQ